jgi:predicted transcriptional regulator
MTNYETAASRIEVCKKLKKFLDKNKIQQVAFASRTHINQTNISNYVKMNNLPNKKNAETIDDTIDTWNQVSDVVEPVIAEQLNQELWVAVQSLNETIKRAEQLNLLLEITANTLQEETIKLSENLDRSEAKTYLSAV